MKLVKISGGLGNQMFQYALAFSIQMMNKNQKVLLHTNWYDNISHRKYMLNNFNISLQTIKSKKNTYKVYKEKYNFFHASVFSIEDNVLLKGYWQNENYFIEYRNLLLKEFTLKNKLSKEAYIYNKIIKDNESISIHIRRKDYVKNKATNKIHGVCKISYYMQAINFFKKKIKNPYFFIFSDDLKWAKQNFNNVKNVFFLNYNRNIEDYEELILMSNCKHNIIANSTFSWWGAWLNKNNDKIVIAPKKWFKTDKYIENVIPSTWIKM
jgi:hypothetical protein